MMGSATATVIGSFQNQTTTTGSFQNQTTTTGSIQNQTTSSTRVKAPRKRSRGLNSFLRDATNLQVNTKRACVDKTMAGIVQHSIRQDSRGDCVAGNIVSITRVQSMKTDSTCTTLQQILNKHIPSFDLGKS